MLHNNTSNVEYITRRKQDIKKTMIIEKFVDKIYKENNFDIKRVVNPQLQKSGVDIIHTIDNQKRYIDEKFAINYYNKDLHTFAFELSSKNNKDESGWFTSEHMITTHYVILWFKSNDDFSDIYTYDLCYIDKQKIKQYLKSLGYYDGIEDDFKYYWEYGQYINNDNNYYTKNNRRYLKLLNGVKIVQSMQFEVECPINIVIPRTELYKLADYHFHK